jgi:hypothetical protein
MAAWQPERIANSMSKVLVEHRRRAGVEGEKIAEGKLRLKIFLAVFTTL